MINEEYEQNKMNKSKTKIVASIGIHRDVEIIRSLYKAGATTFRLNTAHQTIEESTGIIENIRKVSNRAAILIDTKGPEIRTMEIESPIKVAEGESVYVVPVGTKVEGKSYSVNYDRFCIDMIVGTEILIDDGELSMTVTEQKDGQLVCRVNNSGVIKNRKSVNVPSVPVELPSLSEKDITFIKLAAEMKIDFIAHSFVRNKEDVLAVQKILDEYDSPIKIISKIENREGIDNLDEILDHCHGVMVARGDLGIELPAEDVPLVQKKMISRCIQRSKVVITATQMLHTMIENPRPTRAEVSDVANAVMDGTDAIMLSGETAYGDYALEAVQTMSNIASHTEANFKINRKKKDHEFLSPVRYQLIKSAMDIGKNLEAKAIITQTDSGQSASLLASFRGETPIFALSPRDEVVRQLNLTYGVNTYFLKYHTTLDDMISESVKVILEEGILTNEDMVVLVGSSPQQSTVTNFLEVGEMSQFLGGRE